MKSKLIVLFLIGLAATGFFYAHVDRKVSRRLDTRGSDRMSAVYSDAFRLSSGMKVPPAALLTRLEARNYIKVDEEPGKEGEYRMTDELLEVMTRQYRSAEGATIPSVHATYTFATAAVKGKTEKGLRALSLEPLSLAPLGSGEVRASSYRNLKSFPPYVSQAFLSIEDKRYYSHFGVDPLGIMRAMGQNIKAGRFVQGGSTLTQQLAKNILFTPRKTLGRKLMEMFAAVSLEFRLTKEEILDMYLNEIYFSQEGSVSVHGVPEAANNFFGKDVGELTLSEAALLAGMVQAPTAFSPRRNYERSIERRDVVLLEMKEQGVITQKELDEARKQKIKIVESIQHGRKAPYFVAMLEKELSESFNVEAAPMAGVAVHTSIDPELQQCAEQAVARGVEKLKTTYPGLRRKEKPIEQALVAIEPFSGAVKAWVGGSDFSFNQFDHVNQAHRQIGSTIKPFLYLTSMDGTLNDYKVATTTSVLSDEPTGITMVHQTTWHPENYDHKYRGDVTLRYALEHSLNIPAVYVAQRVGIPALVKTARKFRLGDEIPAVPSIALGAVDTTLLRLTSAYGAIANGGIYVLPRLFQSAVDSEGLKLATSQVYEERIVDEGAVYIITDILRGVIERGTGTAVRKLGFDRPAAGKTGTSDEGRDAWFVGFTPNLVAGVWTGFDDNKKTGLTGGSGSVPVWTDFMKCAAPYLEPLSFIPPPSVVTVPIDKQSFARASEYCPDELVVSEIYVKGTEPQRLCHIHTGSDSYNDYQDEPYSPDMRREPARPRQRQRGGLWSRIFGE